VGRVEQGGGGGGRVEQREGGAGWNGEGEGGSRTCLKHVVIRRIVLL
jgi:hypothetical protein